MNVLYKKKFRVVLIASLVIVQSALIEAKPVTVGKLKYTIADIQPDQETTLYIYYPLQFPRRTFSDIFSPYNWYKHIISVWKSPQVSSRSFDDVGIAEGKFPLLIYSHGYMGDPQELAWLLTYLADQGFIVAAIEQIGSSFKTFDLQKSVQPWKQAERISHLITYLQTSPLQEYIQFDQIGYIGYSKGGMVGLWLAGGTAPNLSMHPYIIF